MHIMTFNCSYFGLSKCEVYIRFPGSPPISIQSDGVTVRAYTESVEVLINPSTKHYAVYGQEADSTQVSVR